MTFDVYTLGGREADLYRAAAAATPRGRSAPNGPPNYIGEHGYLNEIKGIYDDWLGIPSPDDFAHITDALLRAMTKISPEGFTYDKAGTHSVHAANTHLPWIKSAGDELQNWTGEAAYNFRINYADKFTPTASSQFLAYYVAREAVNAEAAVWQVVRETLDDLSKNAITQMKHVNDCTSDDWKMGLEIAGAVVAVAAAIPTAGASAEAYAVTMAAVGAGVAVASTGMDVASSATAGHTDSLGLGNGSPKEIVSELKRALKELKTRITTQEDKVVKALDQATAKIGADWNSFCLPTPDLAGARAETVGRDNLAGHPY